MLVIRIVFSIVYFVYAIPRRITLFIYKKPPSIPPITDSLLTLSATTVARKIRQREITSYDVVIAYKNRIQEIECINAVVDTRFRAAIIEAKICDEQLKAGKFDIETLEKEKPLYGVPFSVKESYSVKGCSNTGCTLARKGIKANYDSDIVQTLRNAGAIPLCVTNTPEMCGGLDSTNLLYGRTCNPYDTRYSAGGSSGGEGALLGAGASLIGIGSDLGGSVRIPALFNGVFGYKPTTKILLIKEEHFPTSEDKVFQMITSFGMMARYAEDLNLITKVLTSKCDRNLRLDVPVDLKQLKIYYRLGMDKSLGLLPVAPEIEECILKAANYFTQYGIYVDKLPIEWPATIVEIIVTAVFNIKEFPPMLVDINEPKKNAIVEMGKALLGLSQHTKQLILFAILTKLQFLFSGLNNVCYVKQGEMIRQKLLDLLGENGVFIYPTFHGAASLPKFVLLEMLGFSYCTIFNIFGFPAIHVPMGLNRDGLPIGIQVIAAPYQDRLCLAVAKELETTFRGWVPPSISICS